MIRRRSRSAKLEKGSPDRIILIVKLIGVSVLFFFFFFNGKKPYDLLFVVVSFRNYKHLYGYTLWSTAWSNFHCLVSIFQKIHFSK